MSKIIAIDFSITSPAVTILDLDIGTTKFIAFDPKNAGVKFKLPPEFSMSVLSGELFSSIENDIIRFDQMSTALINEIGLQSLPDSKIIFEGYSFAASGQITRIAEACAILKYKLFLSGCDKEIISYAPATIKKFATGSGRAKKPEMVESFKNSTGLDLFGLLGKKEGLKTIPSPITDIVDSYWIAKLAESRLT